MATRGRDLLLRVVVLVALAAAIAWTFYSRLKPAGGDGEHRTQAQPSTDQLVEGDGSPENVGSQPAPDEPAPQAPPQPEPGATPARRARAEQIYREGLELLDNNDPLGARTRLSEALGIGLLSSQQADDCRRRLSEIATKVVFSREIYPGDELARRYVLKPGDTLTGIVRREKLHVPAEGIQRVNRIKEPRRLQAGGAIKLVQGPFDVIVTRHTYTLDMYHHGVFVKSYRIGLGQNGSTPVGRWIVPAGGRVREAPWTPPPGTGTGTIECGQPGYPLGKEGLWIALRGVDDGNRMFSGFGIHGTNEPDSIGRQASLGCIRLREADIAELFAFLCDGQSEVEIRP